MSDPHSGFFEEVSMRLQPGFALLFFAVAAHVFPQTVPAAHLGVWEVTAGAGYTSITGIDATSGNPLLEGVTGWSDVYPNFIGPRFLHGLGMEAKGYAGYAVGINPIIGTHDVILNLQKAYGGGAIYSWRHFSRFRPYGKYLMEFGTLDFNSHSPSYTSDTRTLYVPGGGIDCKVLPRIWVRADYERQAWHNLFATPGLFEQVVTVGAFYQLPHIHVH
jgi:hypothetical protein